MIININSVIITVTIPHTVGKGLSLSVNSWLVLFRGVGISFLLFSEAHKNHLSAISDPESSTCECVYLELFVLLLNVQ